MTEVCVFPVVEIFTSIQGEGVNLGKPANFIRLAGCNLKCPWCDTDWTKIQEYLTAMDILAKLDPSVELVVITGGEPLLQMHLDELLRLLCRSHYKIAIETNGSFPTNKLKNKYGIHVSCSPKPQNDWKIHPECIYDELKFVVDGNFTADKIPCTNKPIWLQPEGGSMQKRWKEAVKIQGELLAKRSNLDVRVGVQLHKIMEVR